jgi:hypothetical protein
MPLVLWVAGVLFTTTLNGLQNRRKIKRYDGERIVLLDDEFNIVGLNDKHKSNAHWALLQILSVMHTGTNFLIDLLRNNGWYVKSNHWVANDMTLKSLVICPIRDPLKTYITWVSRNRKDDFLGQWTLFNQAYLNNPDLHIVPVDTQDRGSHLDALSTRLKCQLNTGWQPLGSGVRRDVEITDSAKNLLTQVYNLPVVKKFYPASLMEIT